MPGVAAPNTGTRRALVKKHCFAAEMSLFELDGGHGIAWNSLEVLGCIERACLKMASGKALWPIHEDCGRCSK